MFSQESLFSAGGSKCKIQQVLTPGGTSRSTATRVLPPGNQEEDESVDEEEDVGEDLVGRDQIEGEDLEVEEELGYIETEKRRRRMKRIEEEKQSKESKLKQDAFWYSGPTTPSPSPPTVKTNFMSKLDLGKVGLAEEEELRQELLEECLDCFRYRFRVSKQQKLFRTLHLKSRVQNFCISRV